jgi:hypothetical protein
MNTAQHSRNQKIFTTERLDWGASLVGEETKWRLAAVASKPFLSNKPPFCFLGDPEAQRKTTIELPGDHGGGGDPGSGKRTVASDIWQSQAFSARAGS